MADTRDSKSTPDNDSPAFPAGSRVGRYIVEERIGSGAMGHVYAALDPELNRKVALKLVRGDVSEGASAGSRRARLVREAQAQARLSHRNVVTVLDVGTVDDQVFVAMELIDGVTLRTWLKQDRPWQQVLTTFRDAGRGLAAAHAAGLIHRDFKPDNVLVAADGRVCVTDFGLARAIDSDDDSAAADAATTDSLDSDPLGTPLTRTGALLGTPRYMAPEQHKRQRVDERTDQFSFCVALYEGLYGEHPFGGNTVVELADAVLGGSVKDAPARTKVPGWLRRVVVKGLSRAPGQRYPDMKTLLAGLSRDPVASRRRWLAVGGGAVLVGGAVLAFSLAGKASAAVCTDGDQQWRGIWDEQAKTGMKRQFEASNSPIATREWTKVATKLDTYVARWSELYDGACRSRRNKQEPVVTSDQRDSCLSKRRLAVRGLTLVFKSSQPSVVDSAHESVLALPDLDECVDAEALRRQVVAPRDAVTEGVRADIAHARALVAGGHYAEARIAAKRAHDSAVGSKRRALQAEAGLVLGQALSRDGAAKQAESVVQQAINDALAGKADVLVARGYSYLIYLVGAKLARFADAQNLVKRADAAINRVGDPPGLRATFEEHQGFLYRAKGEYSKERDHFGKALKRLTGQFGPQDVRVASAHNNLGGAYFGLDKYVEAAAHHKKALAIYEAQLGKEHPAVASVLTNLGGVAHAETEHKQAQKYHERALAIRRKTLRKGHPGIAKSLDSLGLAIYRQRKFDDAIKLYKQALVIRQSNAKGPHESVALSHHHLADAHMQKRKYDAAMAHYRDAIRIYGESLGKDHPKLGKVIINLGIAYKNLGRYEDALKQYALARPIMEKKLNPKHPKLGRLYSNSAIIYTLQGRHDQAIAATHKALALYEQGLPKGHWRTGMTYYNLGVAYNKADKPKQALIYHRKGLAARQAKGGKNHPAAASSLDEIAIAHWRLGDHASAMKALRESLRIRLTRFKPDGMRAGICHFYMGFVLVDWRKLGQAEKHYRKAVAIFKAKFKPNDGYLAQARTGLGRTLLRAGKPAQALPFLVKAVATRDAVSKGSPGEAGESRWVLAQTLWRLNKDRPRAKKLATRAVADFEASIKANEEVRMYSGFLAKAKAWLATKP